MRYLALGDSYTIGEGVSDVDRWPNQLARLLRDEGVDIEDPHLIARTAWTTDELADAIAAEDLRDTFDLVTLLIGVNDQYRSRPVAPFAAEYTQLLRKARKFAGRKASRVIALSIPDWGATPFAEGRDRALIGKEIEAYNAAAKELVLRAGAHWVDVTTATRRMQTVRELAAEDGLHPSAAMYGEWARLVAPIVREELRPPRRRKA